MPVNELLDTTTPCACLVRQVLKLTLLLLLKSVFVAVHMLATKSQYDSLCPAGHDSKLCTINPIPDICDSSSTRGVQH